MGFKERAASAALFLCLKLKALDDNGAGARASARPVAL